MKPTITPTNNQHSLSNNEFIVSKTDARGRITYANRTFMKIAGYPESQLLGVQHNIVRHPDMPRGVFRFLWNTLEQGNEFFGFVKNMCANGDFYWVFANVTPDYDRNSNLQGYFSVRRKPSPKAVETIEPIYREMLAIEQRATVSSAPDESIAYLTQVLEQQGTPYEELVLSLQAQW